MKILYFVLSLMSFKINSSQNKINYDELDKKYQIIEQNVKGDVYKRIRVFENDDRGPCEHILYYDKNNNLKKIELGAGDRSSTMYFYSYYFYNGLIFINETKIKHDLQDYNNCKKTKILNNKFYYKNNKLMKWVKPNGEVNKNKPKTIEKEKKQLEIIDKYLFFEKNRSSIKKLYKGKGSFSKLLVLDGRKLKIRLKYYNDDPESKIKIYTKDYKDDFKEIIFIKNQPLKNRDYLFDIKSIYAFNIRIRTNKPDSFWKLKIEFEKIND